MTRSRTRLAAAAALAACSLATAASTGAGVSAEAEPAAKLPRALWAVEVDARLARSLGAPRLAAFRRAGINALVADSSRIRGRALASLRRKAARARLLVIAHQGLRTASAARPRTARVRGVNVKILRAPGATRVPQLRLRPGRTLVLARLAPSPVRSKAPWRAAIRAARASARLDLSVGPVGVRSTRALDAYLALLSEQPSSNPPPPPPPPGGPPPPPPPGGPPPPPPPPPPWWPPPPPPVPDAPASVWVSTIGDDGTCARLDSSRPCRSFLRAFQLAQPGDQIEVAGGSYGKLTIPASATKPSDVDVVFRPAVGATVTLGCDGDTTDCIEIEGKHVTVKNMRTADFPAEAGMPRQGGVCICRGSDDVTLYNIDAGHFFIAADNARIVGGDYGPIVDEVSKIEFGTGRAPSNILIEGAYIHDHRSNDRHPECLAFYSGTEVTIRGNRFNNCETFGIFFAPGDEISRNVLIENNFFSNTGRVSMSAHIKTRSTGTCHNILIRHNTFVDKNVISECPGTGTRWESNVYTNYGCPSVGTADFNVNTSRKCGANDLVVADLGLVERNGLDFHLRADSPARGRGNPAAPPPTDIDGEARPNPAGAAPDAGADERP